MARKLSISLRTLANQLNAEIVDMVLKCEQAGIKPSDWEATIDTRIGRTTWKGQVSAGLAETIREWHRNGSFRKLRSDGDYAADLIMAAAQEAENNNAEMFGDKLEAIIHFLKQHEVDLGRPRGRGMVWEAWRLFAGSGRDFERWVDCPSCRTSHKPEIDHRFSDDFIAYCVIPRRKQTARQRNLFACEACRPASGRARKPLKHPS